MTLADQDKDRAIPLVRQVLRSGLQHRSDLRHGQALESARHQDPRKKKISEGSEEILDSIRKGHVTYILNTLSSNDSRTSKDGYQIRRCAVENNVTVFTSLDTVNVLLDVLEEITMGVSTIDQN